MNNHQKTVTQQQLTRLLNLDTQLLKWANDWAEGYGTTSPTGGQTGSGKNGINRPTETRSLTNTEGAGLAARCQQLHEQLMQLIHHINQLDRKAATLQPLTPHSADITARQQDPRHWGAGDCLACRRYVPGTSTDRLRGGLCRTDADALRYAQRNNPTLDRQAWIRARQAEEDTANSPQDGEHKTAA